MDAILVAHTTIAENIPGYVDHDEPVAHCDDLVEQAGRLCYESWDRPNPKTATNEGYINNILMQGHHSVLEHSTVTIYISGVTRNLTHEFIRHRHFSYSEVSQRYCNVENFEFVEHPGLETINDETRKAVYGAIGAGRYAYKLIVEDLTEQGKSRKEARQAARHALVSGTETKILVTGNLRAWMDMLLKRLAPAADAEFRELAEKILEILKEVSPNTFRNLAPFPE